MSSAPSRRWAGRRAIRRVDWLFCSCTARQRIRRRQAKARQLVRVEPDRASRTRTRTIAHVADAGDATQLVYDACLRRSCPARGAASSPLFDVSATIIRKPAFALLTPDRPAGAPPPGAAARRRAAGSARPSARRRCRCPSRKVTRDRRRAVRLARRRHVEESFDAVQLLLDDLRDVGCEHRGIRARIDGADRERRRRDRRILLDRQRAQRDDRRRSRIASAITQEKTGRSMKKRGVIGLLCGLQAIGCAVRSRFARHLHFLSRPNFLQAVDHHAFTGVQAREHSP